MGGFEGFFFSFLRQEEIWGSSSGSWFIAQLNFPQLYFKSPETLNSNKTTFAVKKWLLDGVNENITGTLEIGRNYRGKCLENLGIFLENWIWNTFWILMVYLILWKYSDWASNMYFLTARKILTLHFGTRKNLTSFFLLFLCIFISLKIASCTVCENNH